MITLKYKAYNNRRNRKLHEMFQLAGQVWNHALALQKRYYALYKKHINVYRLQKHIAKIRNSKPHWKRLNSQTVQEICQRLDQAYKRFFKKMAKRPPKFKKSKLFSSFTMKQSGWKIDGNKLTLKKLERLSFHYQDIMKTLNGSLSRKTNWEKYSSV